jgi:hypothetical protein
MSAALCKQDVEFTGASSMSAADELRAGIAHLEVIDDHFSEAVVSFHDGSQLRFRHRVDERWVQVEPEAATGQAARLLARIARFRLNAKHLDLTFDDGSQWEARFTS